MFKSMKKRGGVVLYLRQPIITVLGHVDAGKTTLLDRIRGTTVQLREVAGMILVMPNATYRS